MPALKAPLPEEVADGAAKVHVSLHSQKGNRLGLGGLGAAHGTHLNVDPQNVLDRAAAGEAAGTAPPAFDAVVTEAAMPARQKAMRPRPAVAAATSDSGSQTPTAV